MLFTATFEVSFQHFVLFCFSFQKHHEYFKLNDVLKFEPKPNGNCASNRNQQHNTWKWSLETSTTTSKWKFSMKWQKKIDPTKSTTQSSWKIPMKYITIDEIWEKKTKDKNGNKKNAFSSWQWHYFSLKGIRQAADEKKVLPKSD